MSKRSLRARLVELFSRVIKVDKTKNGDVYWNGEDNLYPNEIERIVNNSPTAKRACSIMGKYIAGKGLVDETKDVIVNPKKNYKLSNVVTLAGKSVAMQGGVYIHVGYGLSEDLSKIIPKTLDVLNYTKCRKAKEDDDKNEGKFFYKEYCDNKSLFGKKEETPWFYPFNKKPEVVLAQIKADYALKNGEPTDDIVEMLPHYRGQVYYLNLTPEYPYALAPVDSVYNDSDSEYRISLYTNTQTRTGFLGKTAIITNGLDEETATKVDEDIADWLGSENAAPVFRMDVESADNLDNVLKVIQLDAQYNEKLFEKTNANLETKILGAFNSIPEILVKSSPGAIFGTSGEEYKQAKIFYSEQTEDERWKLSEMFTYLGFPCEIKPIAETGTEDKSASAQAQLRASVGGVTNIIETTKAVSQGYMQRESAIKMLEELYGFDNATATLIIGTPIITIPETDPISI